MQLLAKAVPVSSEGRRGDAGAVEHCENRAIMQLMSTSTVGFASGRHPGALRSLGNR